MAEKEKFSDLDLLINLLGLQEGEDGRLIIPSKSDLIAKGQNVTLREAMLFKLNFTGLKVTSHYKDHRHAAQLTETFPLRSTQIAAGKGLSSPSPSISGLRSNIQAVKNKFSNEFFKDKGLSLDSKFKALNNPQYITEIALQDQKKIDKSFGEKIRKPGTTASKYLVSVSEEMDFNLSLYGGEGLKDSIDKELRAEGGKRQPRGTKKPDAFPEPKGPLLAQMNTIAEMPDQNARIAGLLRTIIPFRGEHEVYDIQVYDPAKWKSFDAFLDHTRSYKKEIVPYYRLDEPNIINIVPEGMSRGKKNLAPKRLTLFLKNLIQDQIATNAKDNYTGHALFPDVTTTSFTRNLKKAGMADKFSEFEPIMGRSFKNASDFRKVAPSVLLGLAQRGAKITGAEISKILSHHGTEELLEGMERVTAKAYAAGLPVDETVPFKFIETEIAKALNFETINEIASYVSDEGTYENNKKNTIPIHSTQKIIESVGDPSLPAKVEEPLSPEKIIEMEDDARRATELREVKHQEVVADKQLKTADTRLQTAQKKKELDELLGTPTQQATEQIETPEQQVDKVPSKSGRTVLATFEEFPEEMRPKLLALQAEGKMDELYDAMDAYNRKIKADPTYWETVRKNVKKVALALPVGTFLKGAVSGGVGMLPDIAEASLIPSHMGGTPEDMPDEVLLKTLQTGKSLPGSGDITLDPQTRKNVEQELQDRERSKRRAAMMDEASQYELMSGAPPAEHVEQFAKDFESGFAKRKEEYEESPFYKRYKEYFVDRPN